VDDVEIMVELARMGAAVSVAEGEHTPLGRSFALVMTLDQHGNEVVREVPDESPRVVLNVLHFVDLSDGRRITANDEGAMTLFVPVSSSLRMLLAGVRETIFEDELREVEVEPRWTTLLTALNDAGVVADEELLAGLPFDVELGDSVRDRFPAWRDG
jgi:hypothetical protein